MNQIEYRVKAAAMAAIASCAIVALADIVAWTLLVGNYSPISETISALAVGDGSWLLDLGLWAFAFGCLALGYGMSRWYFRDRAWMIAAVAVMLLCPVIGTIAFFNEYAGQHNAGADIHLIAVYALGFLVAAAAFLMTPALKLFDERWSRQSLIFAIAWVILAPLFFVVPNAWNGGYERFLALMLLGWIVTTSSILVRYR